MEDVARLQRSDGSVPAFPDVDWVCSTGLFQYAIVWYKLGDRHRGDAAFEYASQLQNPSGGWFGSWCRRGELRFPARDDRPHGRRFRSSEHRLPRL